MSFSLRTNLVIASVLHILGVQAQSSDSVSGTTTQPTTTDVRSISTPSWALPGSTSSSRYSPVRTVTASTSPLTAAVVTVTPFFQYAAIPASLEGSVISRVWEADIASVIQEVIYYQVDCPKASSPENDACRSLGIYPAVAYHSNARPVYGGTITASAQQATTTWRCEFGGIAESYYIDQIPATAVCDEKVMLDNTLTSRTTTLDGCQVLEHLAPMNITAGSEKLFLEYRWLDPSRLNWTIDEYTSVYSSARSTAGCPARPTLGTSTATASTEDVSSVSTTPTSVPTSSGDRVHRNAVGSWVVVWLMLVVPQIL